MFSFFYNIVFFIGFLAFLPKIIFAYFFQNKYRKSFFARLGRGYQDFPNKKRVIWIHAPSLGETKAVVELVKKIKQEFPECYLLFTSTTETGYEEAKKSISFADNHLFFPFDLGWVIRPIVRKVCPELVILCESDFWYNFLDECQKVGAKTFLVNGKISLRSLKRYKKFTFFSKALFSKIHFFCIQSHRYLERFASLNIPTDKMKVTGNIKLDSTHSHSQVSDLKNELKISDSDVIFVAGSTHSPEEKFIIDAMKTMWTQFPNAKLLVVPRHPERFMEVENVLKNSQLPFGKYTKTEMLTGNEKVLLIDAVGILKTCYQICDLAFVGGSFSLKVGGHNILEPCYYAKPVIFGPYMHSQLDLVEVMHEFKAGIQTTREGFSADLMRLFSSFEERNELGQNGICLINAMQGASTRTFDIIRKNLSF